MREIIVDSFESFSKRGADEMRDLENLIKTEQGRIKLLKFLFGENGKPYGFIIEDKGNKYECPHYKVLDFRFNKEMRKLINIHIKKCR